MTTGDGPARFDLYVRRDFFDAATRAAMIAELRSARDAPVTVYGRDSAGSIDEKVRKGMRHDPSPETVAFVRRRLLACQREIEAHFGVSLTACEEPQFLRYRVGDFFVAHQDGNTGMLRLDKETRRVSVVIFLSQQSDEPDDGDYCGGSLIFHEWRPGRDGGALRFAAEPGTLVAFRSETTHEVTAVTHGERHAIACWFR